MNESSKVGRHTSLTPCTHCVMVRFDDLEWDKLLGMMDKADEKKALHYLYKLEKATVEMAKILAEVKALTVRFDEAWSQKQQ